jgi:hypothetical protein
MYVNINYVYIILHISLYFAAFQVIEKCNILMPLQEQTKKKKDNITHKYNIKIEHGYFGKVHYIRNIK